MIEKIPGFRIDVERAREASFKDSLQYTIQKTTRDLDEYLRFLPKFDGLTVLDVIEMKLEAQERVRVLDIGAGKGKFLNDLKKKFPRKISGYGVSAKDYRVKSYPKSIDYRVGDAQRLKEIFPGQVFDCVVSVFTFPYIADTLHVLSQAYDLVTPNNGFIFIEKPSISVDEKLSEKLKAYWEKSGILAQFPLRNGFTYPELAIQKTRYSAVELPTPFMYKPGFERAFGPTSFSKSSRYYLSLE